MYDELLAYLEEKFTVSNKQSVKYGQSQKFKVKDVTLFVANFCLILEDTGQIIISSHLLTSGPNLGCKPSV